MIQPEHIIGSAFPIQFVWQLPNGDYLRAVFETEVVGLEVESDRYIVQLERLIASRQEDAAGEMRPPAEMSAEYWQLVHELVGRKAAVAYEAQDGRPLRLRLPTLTREHPYFTRYATEA